MNKKDIHLVLIHGFVFNKTIWHDLAEKLSQTYTVHLIDLPGYGEQKNVKAHDLDEVAKQVLKQIPPADKLIWVGWSLGGLVARKLAQQLPERTQGIITLAANPKFIASEDWPCAVSYGAFYTLKKLFLRDPKKALTRFIMLQGQDIKISRPIEAFKQYCESFTLETLLRDLDLLEANDLRDLISQLTTPALNILGTHDRLVPVSVLEQLKHLSAHAQNVTIKDAGHALLLSHVTECLTLMDQFINESIITE